MKYNNYFKTKIIYSDFFLKKLNVINKLMSKFSHVVLCLKKKESRANNKIYVENNDRG